MRTRRCAALCLSLAAIAAGGGSLSGQAPGGRADTLALLIRAQGVSGCETGVRDVVRAQLPAWAHPRTDEIGNLIVTVGQGRPHVLIAAAIDEDGYVVSRVMDDGYLRVQRVTTGVTNRFFDQYHYGQPVLIGTRTGAFLPGVIGSASQHLQRGREQANTVKSLDDLWIDVGAESGGDVAKLGIQLLDPVALRDRVQMLANGRIAGVAAQARAHALALIALVQSIDEPPAAGTLSVAWASQGSFGERGFARLAEEVDADSVIVLARAAAAAKGAGARGEAGSLGRGPLVLDGDSQTLDVATRATIAVQAVSPTLFRTPTAWPTARVRLLGLPVLFMHTPVETVDEADGATLVTLLRSLAALPPVSAAATRPSSAPPPPHMPQAAEHAIFRFLRPLIETHGVSEHEAPVREAVRGMLPAWARPETDERGNMTVRVGRGGTPLAFVAHLDELGYEVTAVLDDGTATVRNRGGMSDMGHEAHPILVHSARGPVPAIVAPRSDYLRAEDARPRSEDIRLYFGTATRAATEALGVSRGDAVTVRKSLAALGPYRATARSIDDRNGVAALVAALNRIDPAKIPNTVTFSFVVGEEIGLVGSAYVAPRLRPAYVFAVDTFVSSDSPVDPQRLANIALGSGAVVRAIDNSSITPPATVARIVEIARARRIPVSIGTTNGGNDGSSFSRYGTIVAPLSWPGRYSHSPVEVMDVRDLNALVDLIVAIASEPKF